MPNVGILAGTFDPIHAGHIACCIEAKERYELERVTLMVEPRPWRKEGVTPYDTRYEMALIGTQSYPDIILEYSEHEQFSVAGTLPIILAKNEGMNVYLIMGSDEYVYVPNWEGVSKLVASVGFIVVMRDGTTDAMAAETTGALAAKAGVQPRCATFTSAFPQVSSRKIRHDLKESGHSDYLDPLVETYIKGNALYNAMN